MKMLLATVARRGLRGAGFRPGSEYPPGRSNVAPGLVVWSARLRRRSPFRLAVGSEDAAPIQFISDAVQGRYAVRLNALEGRCRVGHNPRARDARTSEPVRWMRRDRIDYLRSMNRADGTPPTGTSRDAVNEPAASADLPTWC
jgi:hypothetical protein